MVSRHSSGSRRAAISVEPTRSQNNTVRCRRSPPAAATMGEIPAAAAGTASPKAAPHSPQNLSSGWFVAPHLGQVTTSGAPQAAQNLRPSRLSLPHFEQRISPPDERLNRQLIEQRLGLLEVGGVKALGEPVVDFAEHRARFVALALRCQQAREAG